jgi:AcrR family transcriptional regulator
MAKANNTIDEERRKAILDAALYCFLHFGYSKTSMDDVAKKANLSRPLIYLKFKNKEDLLLGIFDHIMLGRVEEGEKFLDQDMGPREKLLKVFDVLTIQPWASISGFPMSPEFFGTCEMCDSKSFEKFQKNKLKFATAILNDKALAEVFVMAIHGQMEDLPTVNVLKKRLEILITRFTDS